MARMSGELPDLKALTIVEQDTTVGGTVYDAGTILIQHDGSDDIQHLELTSAGSDSSGTLTQFIDVDDIDIGNGEIDALELIETSATIGGETVLAGELLVSIGGDDASIGNNSIAVDQYDIAKLNITAVGANTVATADLFFDGSDVGLDTGDEDIKSLTLVPEISTTDKAGPVATSVVMSDSALKVGETSTLTITFSEAVTGFDNSDLTFENGDVDQRQQ